MKIKIAILGSTGSIGKSLLKIILKINNYEINLLTCNKFISVKTIQKFNVKN